MDGKEKKTDYYRKCDGSLLENPLKVIECNNLMMGFGKHFTQFR